MRGLAALSIALAGSRNLAGSQSGAPVHKLVLRFRVTAASLWFSFRSSTVYALNSARTTLNPAHQALDLRL